MIIDHVNDEIEKIGGGVSESLCVVDKENDIKNENQKNLKKKKFLIMDPVNAPLPHDIQLRNPLFSVPLKHLKV